MLRKIPLEITRLVLKVYFLILKILKSFTKIGFYDNHKTIKNL
jgi:hypothetical protein